MYVPERVRKVEVGGCGVIALPDTRVRRSRQLSRSFAAVLPISHYAWMLLCLFD